MKSFAKTMAKVFLFIFVTTALAGFLVGGVAGIFMLAVRMAPLALIGAAIVYGIFALAKYAEDEEKNQSLNLAKAMKEAKKPDKDQEYPDSPIIP